MGAREAPLAALLPTASRWCWCVWLCALTLGCRAPIPSPAKPTVVATANPAPTADPAAGGAPPVAAPSEPGRLQSDPQVTRLPPIEPAREEHSTGREDGIRLVAAYTAERTDAVDVEALPSPDEVIPLSERLKLPPDLPGAAAPPIRLPTRDPGAVERRDELIDQIFPNRPLPPALAPQADGLMTLKQIEDLALANNPELVQAVADITTAGGQAVQAGVHPNPVVGYEADTVDSAGTRNYQGIFATQTIKTANKLGMARNVANFDVIDAQLALRKTRYDVLSRVKGAYFAVLVAQQNVEITSAIAWLTNESYRIQVEKLRLGEGTGYEPAQLRSLSVQARAAAIQAQNTYVAAWKQLAALVGVPDLPTARLEGRADMPPPVVDYEVMLARVLNNHPDVLVARNLQAQAELNLRLQKTIPIPDVQLYGTFQRDFTTPNIPRTVYNVQFGLPLPLWDRNRGNIASAEGQLRRAAEQVRRTRNELTASTADAFGRLATARYLVQSYHDQILPDLGRAYRGVYDRHQQEPEAVGFSDIIVAQQNLAVGFVTYVASLADQWAAVADIANLMQVEDLNEISDPISDAPFEERMKIDSKTVR